MQLFLLAMVASVAVAIPAPQGPGVANVGQCPVRIENEAM